MRKLLTLLFALLLSIAAASAQEAPPSGFQPIPVGVDANAEFLVLSSSSFLTNERVVVLSSPLAGVDGGSTYTISLGIVPATLGGSGQATLAASLKAFADAGTGASAAAGDLLVRDTSTWLRLAKGADGTYLTVSGGTVGWGTPPTGAPADAQYYVAALNAGLSNETVLSGGTGIDLTAGSIDIDSTVTTLTGSQTLTNKTLTDPKITYSATEAVLLKGTTNDSKLVWADWTGVRTVTLPELGGNYSIVGTLGAQTIAGVKTFSASPVLSTNTITTSGANTVTLPNATGTVVYKDTTDVLTNKELTTPTITSAGSITFNQVSGNYVISANANNPAATRTYRWYDAGGTGDIAIKSGTPTNGGVALGDGNKIVFSSAGSSGQPLISSGTAASFGTLGVAGGGTAITSYTAGDILTVNDAGTLVKLAGGTNADVLTYDNTGNPNVKWAAPAASGGTVTDFSAGDLSPLFTTTEATTTTTPALSFALSNAAAHTFFGNATGSTAAPSFSAIGAADISAAQYDSGEQTITAAGLLTLNHLLGYVPTDVRAVLVCKTANLGYSVNDIVVYPPGMHASSFGVNVTTTSTQLVVRFGSAAGAVAIAAKATGVYTAITAASWKIRFYAR